MSSLTEAQKKLIEEKRQKALAIRNAKRQKTLEGQPSVASFFSTPKAQANEQLGTNGSRVQNRQLPNEVSIVQEIRKNVSVMPVPVRPRPQTNILQRAQNNVQPQPQSSRPSNGTNYPSKPLPHKSNFSKPGSVTSSFGKNINAQSNIKQQNKSPPTASSNSGTNSAGQKGSKISVKVTLTSNARLYVDFPYNLRLVESVKKLLSSKFEQDERRWKIHISDYMNLIDTLKTLQTEGMDVEVDKGSVPARVVSLVLNEKNSQDSPVDLSEKLKPGFIDNLYPFQREGVKFAIRKKGRCLIADDMGLGKTVQALGAACWFKDDWPLLIVCPASVAVNWKNNVIRWLDFVSDDDVEVFDKVGPFSRKRVVVVSYDRLVKVVEDVIKRKMNFVIFDECHSIKNSDAQRTRAALQVAKTVKRVILLSGTPALSRPMELYTQILAVNPALFPKKHDFGVRYCDARLKFMGRAQVWDFSGSSNTDELKTLLESTIMIRRLKTDVLNDLPQKKRSLLALPLKLTEEEQIEMDKMDEKVRNSSKLDKRSAIMEWYVESAKLKAKAVIEYVEKKLDKGKKFICFGYHKVILDGVAEYLRDKGVSFIVITGETPPKIRQDCCDYFQNKETCRVAVVSILAAGVGITLTAAHEVVFTELYWNPGIITQAEDRAHRIGQEDTVSVEYLLSPNTIDEYLWKLVGRKLNVLNKVGLSEDNMKHSASRDSSQSTIESYFSKAVQEPSPEEDDEDIMILEG